MRLLTVALLALLLPAAGCVTETLHDEWEDILRERRASDLMLEGFFPQDGSYSVGLAVRPYSFANRRFETAELPQWTLQIIGPGGSQQVASGVVDSDRVGADFTTDPWLAETQQYGFSLEGRGGAENIGATGGFSTGHAPGLLFDMTPGLEALDFGGNRTQVGLLNQLFEPEIAPLWLLKLTGLTNESSLPLTTELCLGPGKRSTEGLYFIDQQAGLFTRFEEVSIDAAGAFSATEEGVFFLMPAGNSVVVTWLEQAMISGVVVQSPDGARIDSFELSGILGPRWLLRLAEADERLSQVVNGVLLDEDTNGNGRNDAISFGLGATPRALDPTELL